MWQKPLRAADLNLNVEAQLPRIVAVPPLQRDLIVVGAPFKCERVLEFAEALGLRRPDARSRASVSRPAPVSIVLTPRRGQCVVAIVALCRGSPIRTL